MRALAELITLSEEERADMVTWVLKNTRVSELHLLHVSDTHTW